MGFVIRLRNLSPGPWKIRFRDKAPKEAIQMIDSLVKPGGRLLVPEAITPYIDEEHLVRCVELGVITFQKVPTNRAIPTVPVTKVIAPTPKSLTSSSEKVEIKREATPSKPEAVHKPKSTVVTPKVDQLEERDN